MAVESVLHLAAKQVKKLKTQVANILTLTNLFLGGFAMIEGIKENYTQSISLILFAAFIDRLDGIAARRLQIESSFGKQLDSMSDIISFGVAPALLIYQVILADYATPASFSIVFFIACGALRLARFNLTNDSEYFIGLPITAAGCLLVLSLLLSPVVPVEAYVILITILSLLMVSPFKLKKI